MIRSAAVAAFVAVILGAPAAHAFGGSWQCKNQMDMDRDEAWELSGNIAMFRIVNEYRERWDVHYKRQQCEAFAASKSYDISCLNNRRDWDAIKTMVPSEYFGMSARDLTPHYQELQMADDGIREMVAYCRSVGAIE